MAIAKNSLYIYFVAVLSTPRLLQLQPENDVIDGGSAWTCYGQFAACNLGASKPCNAENGCEKVDRQWDVNDPTIKTFWDCAQICEERSDCYGIEFNHVHDCEVYGECSGRCEIWVRPIETVHLDTSCSHECCTYNPRKTFEPPLTTQSNKDRWNQYYSTCDVKTPAYDRNAYMPYTPVADEVGQWGGPKWPLSTAEEESMDDSMDDSMDSDPMDEGPMYPEDNPDSKTPSGIYGMKCHNLCPLDNDLCVRLGYPGQVDEIVGCAVGSPCFEFTGQGGVFGAEGTQLKGCLNPPNTCDSYSDSATSSGVTVLSCGLISDTDTNDLSSGAGSVAISFIVLCFLLI